MENRRPEGTAAAGGANRMRWLLLAAGVLVILLVLVATARLLAPGNADPWRDRGAQTVGQSATGTQAPADEAAPPVRPALIIDAAAGGPAVPRDNPLALVQPAAASSEAGATPDAASSARSASTAPARAAAQRRAAAPQARGGLDNAAAQAADADNNLISTLLGIIRQDGAATAAPSSMDSLVARILAENERTYTETNAALASLGKPQAEGTDLTRAQRELQACPAANTVQGINCRDRVCARWTGRDPACPAR